MPNYIPWSDQMVDGVPLMAGPAATLVSLTTRVPVDEPAILVVSAPPGSVCQLEVFPPDAPLEPIPEKRPDSKGRIEWQLRFDPQYVGGNPRVIMHCKARLGQRELSRPTDMPNIFLLPAKGRRGE